MSEWWDDDPELLGATLGLLAAWDGDAPYTAGAASTSPPSPSPSSDSADTTNASSATPARRTINVSRERRKQELNFLRKKVADMQNQLRDLHDRREAQLRPHFKDEQRTQLATVAPVWENMATRQFQARKKSELLNAKLKTTLNAQLRVAQDLIRVIKLAEERSRAAGPVTLAAPTRLAIDVSHHMTEEEQIARVDMLCETWQSEFARRDEFGGGDAPGSLQFLDMCVVDDSDDGTVIELFSSSLLPYPVARVESAMWSMFLENQVEDENGDMFTQEATVTEDLIISLFSASVTLDDGLRGMYRGKCITKRVHPTATQTVIATHSQTEPQGFADELNGVNTFEDTWVRLVDAKELGHTELSGPLTVLQHVRRERIVVKTNVQEPENSRSRMQKVTEIIMKQIRDEIGWAQSMLENVLMDDSIRVKSEPY